ncbi:acetoacetate decarboxylase family protein [Streptomyces olindensis]|uniref:acetoacetate decarboxylase family protein n=1 Tax=Streptomyces olindensis TaxID=358823 RepID=UPI0033F8B237
MNHTPFPPEPWHLRGTMHMAVWRIPAAELPEWPLPPGVRPLALGRHGCVVTFWVDYLPGGTLAYRELLVAQAVRHRRAVAATAVAAWVDSERSRAGGRTLWGIPKQLAVFDFPDPEPSAGAHGPFQLYDDTGSGRPAVTGRHRTRFRLPGRWFLPGRLIQPGPDGTPREVPLRLTASVSLGTASLTAAPDSPLSFLNGRRPLLALTADGFRFTVGRRPSARRSTP